MTAPTWTPERVAELTRLVALGYSAGQIGVAMGVTRNAAMGKANRLGLELAGGKVGVVTLAKVGAARRILTPQHAATRGGEPKPKPTRAPKPPKPSTDEKQAAPLILEPMPMSEPPPVREPCDILALTWQTCRWPVNTWPRGEGDTARFCGGDRIGCGPYCAEHLRVATRRVA